MRLLLLGVCAILACGCSLSKDESTLAKANEKIKNKKKTPPPGSFTELQMGVKYYPDADQFKSTEYDEGGFHFVEVGLNTRDSADKVREFYEKELGGKSMPSTPPVHSIHQDMNGKHYQIDYGRFGDDTTITIKMSWPTG